MQSEAGRAEDVVDMMESCSKTLRSACRQAGRQAGREGGPDRRSEGLRLRVLEPMGVLPSLHGQDGDLIGVVVRVRVRVRGGGGRGQGKGLGGGGGGGGW